jgi:hypothetical protein
MKKWDCDKIIKCKNKDQILYELKSQGSNWSFQHWNENKVCFVFLFNSVLVLLIFFNYNLKFYFSKLIFNLLLAKHSSILCICEYGKLKKNLNIKAC